MSTDRTGNRLRNRPSSTAHLNRKAMARTSRRSPRQIEVLPKCSSEPLIFLATDGAGDSLSSDSGEGDGGWFGKLHTFNDLFMHPSELSDASSPLNRRTTAGYERDAKVVMTVTVEGSPGPIRALVKLGASVEDTIKLVVQKYQEEGRTPRLDQRVSSSSSFDLHLSYFSLQCLDRTNAIGEVGSRSFYLRKSKVKSHEEVISSLSGLEIMPLPAISKQSSQSSSTMAVFPWFINRKTNKFVRRMHKLFKLFGCLHSR